MKILLAHSEGNRYAWSVEYKGQVYGDTGISREHLTEEKVEEIARKRMAYDIANAKRLNANL